MSDARIISLLPAATEMACALGLVDQLVGVSHECDYPALVRQKPSVVRCALALDAMSVREIDTAVAEHARNGGSLYEVDESLLERLAPTHVLTQALCQVCAPSGNDLTRVFQALPSHPAIVWFTPHSIEGIFENLRDLGRATERLEVAERLIASYRARLQAVAQRVRRAAHRPRVLCLEWIDPYYCCGHWVPEMIDIAGGEDPLGRMGSDSVRLTLAEIATCAPEILVISPCGYGVDDTHAQARWLVEQPEWRTLPAVQRGRVVAVDANAYFARPGPRVVDGTELLAHLFHPELSAWAGPPDAFRVVAPPSGTLA